MNLVIFGDNFTFPEGNASTNRVYTYAKGFVENNVSTHVICFRNDYLPNGEGKVQGIKYYHPINQAERNKYFVIRNWYKLKKYLNTIKLVKKLNREEKIVSIIVYTKMTITHLFAWILTKMAKTKLIIENSEHPLRYYKTGLIKKIIGKIRLMAELRTLDGILLITQDLIDFYKSKLGDNSKILFVPSTVDPIRFQNPKNNSAGFRYIGYFGTINFGRDNVDLLINSFSIIHRKHEDIHLVLGGMYSNSQEKLVKDLIRIKEIGSKVHLLGYMSREEIVQYLINAHILVLVRRNDPYTNASFPCKLTEFLATGNPVITVKVGEIPRYLFDSENAFLVEPGNIDQLADKINFVLENYPFALEVAKKGQKLTETTFNYDYHAKRIIDFIQKISY